MFFRTNKAGRLCISVQIHNYLLLAVFIATHAYFTFVQPNLLIRTINLATGIVFLCSQCAWLLVQRVDAQLRPVTSGVGYVFLAFCLASIVRIGVDLASDPGNNFFQSGRYEALAILTNQMLFILLTFSLLLLVNGRLIRDLQQDIAERLRTQEALRLSEEKFYKAFHSSPDAITITRLHDGQLVDVNEGFLQLTGYSKSVALASSSINLRIWVNAQDRDMCIQALQENGSIHDCEYDFRTVSGKILHCLYSGEIIQLNGESHVLSVVQDITERKQAEAALQRVTEDLRRSIVLEALHQVALDLVNRHNMDEILQTLLERTVSLLGVQQVSIDLIENGDTIVTYAATPGQPLTKGDRMRRGEGGCLSWQAIDTGQPAIVEDYSSWSQRRELFEGFSLYAVAIIPIPRENRIIGAINITRTVSKEPFS